MLTIFIFNITYGAAWSVLVLYSTERLGLGEVGFGLITTVIAVGGLLGTAAYGWLTARLSLGDVMRIGLVIETLTHLGLGLTTSPLVAMPIFFIFGAHAFVWGTTSSAIRQRAVPRAAGARRQRQQRGHLRRPGGRVGAGRPARPGAGRRGALLVRVRGLGAVPGAHLAGAAPHRARRVGARRATSRPAEAQGGGPSAHLGAGAC